MSKWRQKERLKTTAVALVLCLNIGVDPPDVIKISPCARLECWVDPLSMQPPKALETIGALPSSASHSLEGMWNGQDPFLCLFRTRSMQRHLMLEAALLRMGGRDTHQYLGLIGTAVVSCFKRRRRAVEMK